MALTLPDVPESYTDQAIRLTRLLAIAVERLGGFLEVDAGQLLDGDQAYVLSMHTKTPECFVDDWNQKVVVTCRKVNREVGDVLNISGLEKAEFTEQGEPGTIEYRKRFTAAANGVALTHVTDNPDLELWVSPILTMATKGVAVVNAHGIMVNHKAVQR